MPPSRRRRSPRSSPPSPSAITPPRAHGSGPGHQRSNTPAQDEPVLTPVARSIRVRINQAGSSSSKSPSPIIASRSRSARRSLTLCSTLRLKNARSSAGVETCGLTVRTEAALPRGRLLRHHLPEGERMEMQEVAQPQDEMGHDRLPGCERPTRGRTIPEEKS